MGLDASSRGRGAFGGVVVMDRAGTGEAMNGFRVWDKKSKQYLEDMPLQYYLLNSEGKLMLFDDGLFDADPDRYVVEMTLPLECANTGKPIHVGDIVKTSFGIEEVAWDGFGVQWKLREHCKYEGMVPTIIVGNIHDKETGDE